MRRDGSMNEAFRISGWKKLLMLALAAVGGLLYAAALPPLNFSIAVFFSLTGLLYAATQCRWKFMFLCGWVWGVAWAFCSYNFLREIDPAVPYLLAPVLALWPAVWAALMPWVWHRTVIPAEGGVWNASEREDYLKSGIPWWRLLLFALYAASLFTLIEWTRSRLFVWNDFSVTQWRNLSLIQICALTGSYGVGFLVALANTSIFVLCKKWRGVPAFLFMCLLFALALIYGLFRVFQEDKSDKTVTFGLVQADLSQRRQADEKEIFEAVNKNVQLSRKVLSLKPDIIVWPESAVPVPLRASSIYSSFYRRNLLSFIKYNGIPMLIGALDFAADNEQITNSALLLDREGRLTGKYDKIIRVPFGEYIPFRKYLPQFVIDRIDMGRDLAPGHDYRPLPLLSGVRAGVAVCYEGVFGVLTRSFARRDANVLVALSNDAWYPRSSEPEQHLANVVMRCIETGLPMVRCGNNGGSGVVTRYGEFTQYIGSKAARPELLRESSCGVVKIGVAENPEKTFYVLYGEWFVLLLGIFAGVMTVYAFINVHIGRKKLMAALSAD